MGEEFHTYNIHFAKLPSISPVTFISQEEKRKGGRKKQARRKPNNQAPTPPFPVPHIHPFQLCGIQADDPPWPRVIASILPIISRELMQRYRPPLLPFPPP